MSQSICASIIGMNDPKTRRQVTTRRAHRGIARLLTGRRRFAVEPQPPQHVLRCLARFLHTLAAIAPEVARTTRRLQAVRHRRRCSGARRRARPDREAGAQGADDGDEGIHLPVVAAVAHADEQVPTLSYLSLSQLNRITRCAQLVAWRARFQYESLTAKLARSAHCGAMRCRGAARIPCSILSR